MRITEVATLPEGCARFQDTVPELKNAFLVKVPTSGFSTGARSQFFNLNTTLGKGFIW